MPIHPAIPEFVADAEIWRRDLHRNPELLYDLPRTSKFVAERLSEFGCDVVTTGMGRSGVVGLIRGRKGSSSRTIGLRADMDALPIEEEGRPTYRSLVPGKMHACGHDGHTAMLLGAARYLAGSRNFSGNAVVIFQPAEEGGAGARAMIDDGMLEAFPIEEVYGMHNLPGLALGEFAMRKGPIMASADLYAITVTGRGGHAAFPHQCLDPVLAAAQIVTALQAIVSRGVDPLDACVVSVTTFHSGTANNIIPSDAELTGTVRTLRPSTRDFAERRLNEIVAGVAAAAGIEAHVVYRRNYPATVNHPAQTDFAAHIARRVAGEFHVDAETAPMMGAEDFSFMLEARPGAFIFVGNGDSAKLHNASYDFNDAALPFGMSYWAELVETALAE
jgi:hippurate hydrolase